jgi:murein L,D-transpeptidase YcbB/YkuD
MFGPLTINKRIKRPLAALAFLCIMSLLPAGSAAVRTPSAAPPDITTGEKSEFLRLQQALLKYRAIASEGGWPSVSGGTLLKEGQQSERVALLRERLLITGDIDREKTDIENIFDERLRNAVIRFQKRHGLKEDGIVGPETLTLLNIPVDEKIRRMEINLERLRQIEDSSRRFIRINIADFELEVVEDRNIVMTMKVIAGKRYWYTPVFSAEMTYLVFNPSWYVPKSIALREILPEIKREPGYLDTEGLKVYSATEGTGEEIDISTIDWSRFGPDDFPYRFVQPPGPKNPLGRIKFVFPNRFNVYLHDTPAKLLFEESSRAFSHGCIRIEKPVELAEYLLHEDPSWTHERILDEIESGKETKVRLPSTVNVHVLYLTAWVDYNDVINFRKDVYGRDNLP